jgi:hypothetical protein
MRTLESRVFIHSRAGHQSIGQSHSVLIVVNGYVHGIMVYMRESGAWFSDSSS